MKKETWIAVLRFAASIIAAALTALGTSACMSYVGVI